MGMGVEAGMGLGYRGCRGSGRRGSASGARTAGCGRADVAGGSCGAAGQGADGLQRAPDGPFSLSPRGHRSLPSRERSGSGGSSGRGRSRPQQPGSEGISALWDRGRGQRSRTPNTLSISAFPGRGPSRWPAVTQGQRGFAGSMELSRADKRLRGEFSYRHCCNENLVSAGTELQGWTKSRKKGRIMFHLKF